MVASVSTNFNPIKIEFGSVYVGGRLVSVLITTQYNSEFGIVYNRLMKNFEGPVKKSWLLYKFLSPTSYVLIKTYMFLDPSS